MEDPSRQVSKVTSSEPHNVTMFLTNNRNSTAGNIHILSLSLLLLDDVIESFIRTFLTYIRFTD